MNLIEEILKEEALEAKHGAKACELRRKYADENAKFKRGDKVTIDGRVGIIGRITMVKFDTHDFIQYKVEYLKKDGTVNMANPGGYFYKEKLLSLWK